MAETKVAPIASRLRASILQQAVQGKLVPQDPSEGTADELLKRICEERAEFVRQKKAKRPKGGDSRIYRGADGSWYEQRGKSKPVCIDDEIPFDIPERWGWTRFTAAVPVLYGYAFESELFSSAAQIGLIRIRDVNSGNLVRTETGYMGHYSPRYIIHTGDALIGMDGEFHCKQWAGPDALLNQRVCKLEPYEGFVLGFLLSVMDWYLSEINKRTGGTTVKHLSAKALDSMLFAVPPTAEQKRIANKFSQLMPLVDQLEIRERARDAVDTAFWKALPQSILQEAVQGCLVPQHDDDEPADALLERIREERAELVRQKKAKRPKGGEPRIWRGADGSWYEQRGKGEPVCIDNEIPFDIPDSWAWARLSTFALVLNGDRGKYYPAKSKLHKEGIPFVSAINIDNHRVVEDQMLYMTDEQYDALGAGKLEKEDFVFCIRGSLGKYGVFPFEKGAIASSLVIVRAVDDSSVSRDYIGKLLGTPITASEIRNYNNGTAQPNLSAANFERFLYPIPPLAEQERIVSRVDEIMSLLDKALN